MRHSVENRSQFGFDKVSLPVRVGLVSVFFAGVTGAIVVGGMAFVRQQPANIDYASHHVPGKPVDLTIQTVSEMGNGHSEPLWVSYLAKAPDGKWVHSTQWVLPAHTLVHLTEYEFDTGSPLRNQVWGGITGIVGDKYKMYAPGSHKAITVGQVNSYAGNGVAHTFTVPTLGINVPWYGISSNAEHQCAVAPCSVEYAHNTIKLSFYTPGPGQYRWQCFVPCGVGYLDGNGGPMETLGYMAGFLKVVPQ